MKWLENIMEEKLARKAAQRRIAILVNIKEKLSKKIDVLLKLTGDAETIERYKKLYEHFDEVIAEDAKFL